MSGMEISIRDSHIAFFGLLPLNKLANNAVFQELNDQ